MVNSIINPSAPPPTKAQRLSARASRYSDLIVFILGLAVGTVLGLVK